MKVAIIPARGGSKRILYKNIKEFRHKPIISYAIDAARKTGLFDRIIVSTDDAQIAEISTSLGAEVPFIRPSELSGDFTPMREVICHSVQWLLDHDAKPEFIVNLFATSPFVQPKDIMKGFEILEEYNNIDYVLAVTNFPAPIQRALKTSGDHSLKMFHPEEFFTRSQDLEVAYHDAGQFCLSRITPLMGDKEIFDCKCLPLVIPSYRVQDIDTLEDWKRAEILHEVLERNGEL